MQQISLTAHGQKVLKKLNEDVSFLKYILAFFYRFQFKLIYYLLTNYLLGFFNNINIANFFSEI